MGDLKISSANLGWHLNGEFIDDLKGERSDINLNSLTKIALDFDLRNIGERYLSESVSSGKADFFEGMCVLQLIKLRNIAAPKENESSQGAHPMFKITLTDGSLQCNALAINDVNRLTLNTPPGTKVLLKGKIKIKSNLLMLDNQNCEVLGGNVEHLVQKWKEQKELDQTVRAYITKSTAPPWVPFGTLQRNQVDTSQKVFAQNEVQEDDSTSEFSQARQAALAEAIEAKSKVSKTFTQQKVDKSQIIDKIKAEAGRTISATADTIPSSSHLKEKEKPAGKPRKDLRKLLVDDERDYREAKDAARPSKITLFDLVKTRIGDDGSDEAPEVKEEEVREEPAYFGRGGRGGRGSRGARGSRGGRGGGARGFGFGAPKESTHSQAFNPDDFAFDLGDTVDVIKMKEQQSFMKEQQEILESFSKISVSSKSAGNQRSQDNNNRAQERPREQITHQDSFKRNTNFNSQSKTERFEDNNSRSRNNNNERNQYTSNSSNYQDNHRRNDNYGSENSGRNSNYSNFRGGQNRNNNNNDPQNYRPYQNNQNFDRPNQPNTFSNTNSNMSSNRMEYNTSNQRQQVFYDQQQDYNQQQYFNNYSSGNNTNNTENRQNYNASQKNKMFSQRNY